MNRNVITAISIFIIACTVHLAAVLMLPYVAPQDVWTRLAKLGPVGSFYIHSSAAITEAADPNADPAIVMAICRYDLEKAPFRISGEPSLWYWGLALHNNRGFIYYSINNRAIGDHALDLRILTEDDYAAKQQEEVDEAAQEFIVPSPSTRGYVVMRALAPENSSRAQIEETVKKIGCEAYKPAT
ncbi:MAG: hypothetical protein V4691_01665 [Pseudomonadota bacterium]